MDQTTRQQIASTEQEARALIADAHASFAAANEKYNEESLVEWEAFEADLASSMQSELESLRAEFKQSYEAAREKVETEMKGLASQWESKLPEVITALESTFLEKLS